MASKKDFLAIAYEPLLSELHLFSAVGLVEVIKSDNEHQLQLKVDCAAPFDEFHQNLQVLSEKYKVDLILQQWIERNLKPELLIMDMDSTLVQAETIDEIAAVAGLGEKVAAITESAMRGELNFRESLKARVSMLKGISISDLQSVHQRLPLTDGARNLLSKAHENGCHTALVSGGFTFFAGPIADDLGFDTLSANILGINDGVLTGKVEGDIVDEHSKVETLQRLKSQLNITRQQIIAIGDGANDLLMLADAGTGIAFHAKPKVQQRASTIFNYSDLNGVNWLVGW